MRCPSIPSALFLLALALPSSAQEVTLYSTDFTTLAGWTVTTGCAGPPYMWAADASPGHSGGSYVSPPASLNFNNGIDIGGDPWESPPAYRTCGSVLSDPIDLSLANGAPYLRFDASSRMEPGCDWDRFSLHILSGTTGPALYSIPCIDSPSNYMPWTLFEIPLQASWGEVAIKFDFDTIDDWQNMGTGVFIDDLSVVVIPNSELFCFGDGSAGICPCGNASAPGDDAGCRNSHGTAATLRSFGSASLTDDTFTLFGANMLPTSPVLYFQAGSTHAPIPFGDGLKCTGGPFVRLLTKFNQGGVSTYPEAGDLPISVRGMITQPGVRHYQARYRDPLNFCTPDTFNYTNALTVEWGL